MLNPQLLCVRLNNLGIPKKLTNILSDYVLNSKSYIDICGISSDLFSILLGYVQGGVPGPMICSIFIRPITELNIDLTSYADDNYGLIELGDMNFALTNLIKKVMVEIIWNAGK